MNIYEPKNQRDSRYDDDYIDSSDYTAENDYEQVYDNDDIEYVQEYTGRKAEKNRSGSKRHFRLTFKRILLILVLIFAATVLITYLTMPEKTNFLIMATDEDGTRTDTIMIVSFNKSEDTFSMMSVPRDTYVTVSDEIYSQMSAEYPEPGSKSMKINAVHHFAGEKKGPGTLKSIVESLLGINIHYYAKVDFDAFRYIIDAIGGIDFYVPRNMVYTDPAQNLHINLSEGQQRLNGEQAEQVVRYRSGYANADLGRIEVQQSFMKAFMAQALSVRTVVTHPAAYINVLLSYLETDFGITDIISYLFVIGGVDTENIESHVLPGYSKYVGGQSVYMLDESRLEEITVNFR